MPAQDALRALEDRQTAAAGLGFRAGCLSLTTACVDRERASCLASAAASACLSRMVRAKAERPPSSQMRTRSSSPRPANACRTTPQSGSD